jgi:hypothetical protein
MILAEGKINMRTKVYSHAYIQGTESITLLQVNFITGVSICKGPIT